MKQGERADAACDRAGAVQEAVTVAAGGVAVVEEEPAVVVEAVVATSNAYCGAFRS